MLFAAFKVLLSGLTVAFAEDVHGATRGSLEAVHAGRVTPDNLVRRAKTGTSGGAGTASSSL